MEIKPLKKVISTALFPNEFELSVLALIIPKNSENSICPDPSLSTDAIIFFTSSVLSAIPKDINGVSNWLMPILSKKYKKQINIFKFCFLHYLFFLHLIEQNIF